jgi:hypothetical protein
MTAPPDGDKTNDQMDMEKHNRMGSGSAFLYGIPWVAGF